MKADSQTKHLPQAVFANSLPFLSKSVLRPSNPSLDPGRYGSDGDASAPLSPKFCSATAFRHTSCSVFR